jgi:hypothetical protein
VPRKANLAYFQDLEKGSGSDADRQGEGGATSRLLSISDTARSQYPMSYMSYILCPICLISYVLYVLYPMSYISYILCPIYPILPRDVAASLRESR